MSTLYPTASTTWVPFVRFKIPGIPEPKRRPRFSIRGGRPHTYTDDRTRAYEDRVKLFAVSAMAGRKRVPAGVPVRLDVVGVYPLPKSKRRKTGPRGPFYKTTRTGGDADNFYKVIADSLNGIVYDDDSQIAIPRGEVVLAEPPDDPRAEVSVFVPRAWLTATGGSR